MIRVPESPPLTILRDFLVESGFVASRLKGGLGLSRSLYADLANLPALLARTSNETRLAVLARLFFVGWPTPVELCKRYIPETLLQLCVDAGMLDIDGQAYSPFVVVVPFEENLLLTCDGPRLPRSSSDVVIGQSSSTALLAKAMLRNKVDSLLDLGTGTGVLALSSAKFSERVIGTDINPRAISYASFNAALNGITNVDFVAGDCFAAVAGRHFSQIIANPPFLIGARKRFLFCDSPEELDGFALRLLEQAPNYLEDGGIFQMICEWVQIEGEEWQDRLQSRTADSGCDTLVLVGPRSTAIDYGETRALEMASLYRDSPADLMTQRLETLRDSRVEFVFTGVITMRKRRGTNWFAGVRTNLSKNTSAAIEEQMKALTFLAGRSDEDLLNARLQFAPSASLIHTNTYRDGEWQRTGTELSKSDGLEDQLAIDGLVLQTVELFDGKNTLEEIIVKTENALGVAYEDAKARCLSLAKRLVQSSFIVPVASE